MASIYTDSMALRQSIEVPNDRPRKEFPKHNGHVMGIAIPDQKMELAQISPGEEGESPPQDNCGKNHDSTDPTITLSSTSKLAGQTVAPFLARHIPEQYAPLRQQPASSSKKDPNTKYCYRHRPDSKCRRTADEPTMENLQRVCLSG